MRRRKPPSRRKDTHRYQVRIIGGQWKRSLLPVSIVPNLRPTPNRVRETLFNWLYTLFGDRWKEMTCFDLFAGTGNITYEFASRKSPSIIAVDHNFYCTGFIRKTAKNLKYDNVRVIRRDVFQFLNSCSQKFDIIFADPPYDLPHIEKIAEHVFANNLLNPNGWLIIEHPKTEDFSKHPNFYEHRKYGKLNFSFLVQFEKKDEPKTE